MRTQPFNPNCARKRAFAAAILVGGLLALTALPAEAGPAWGVPGWTPPIDTSTPPAYRWRPHVPVCSYVCIEMYPSGIGCRRSQRICN